MATDTSNMNLDELREKVEELEQLVESLRGKVSRGFSASVGAVNELSEAALKGTLNIEKLARETEQFVGGLDDIAAAAGGAINSINPFAGIASDVVGKIKAPFNVLSKVVGTITTVINESINAVDGATSGYRDFNKTIMELGAGYGLSLDQARKFGDYIVSAGTDFANAEYGFISIANRIEASKAMADAGIPLENMSKTIVSTAGNLDFLNTAFLQSQKLGMELTSYMSSLSSAMNVQGLSAQQAFEQMAMYGDIAENTGLQVDSIARSLNNMSDNFAQMGMSANFGRPILEGFTSSLKSMGLGFENALELSSSLSRALGDLTTNYSAAYVTFQRGGLDFGAGGGAMGASIGLRAQMLDAEKRGDQGQLGSQLAGAMRDTLASFTGGNIVTVSQAAASPELQSAYIAQTELLKSMYNISDAGTQDRTLELLQQLSEATEMGDADLAASLGQDLQDAIGQRNDTLSLQEKSASYLSSLVAEQLVTNQEIRSLHESSSEKMNQLISTFRSLDMNSILAQGEQGIQSVQDTISNTLKGVFGESFTSFVDDKIEAAQERIAEGTGDGGGGSGGRNDDLAAKISEGVSASMKSYYDKMLEYINARTTP